MKDNVQPALTENKSNTYSAHQGNKSFVAFLFIFVSVLFCFFVHVNIMKYISILLSSQQGNVNLTFTWF